MGKSFARGDHNIIVITSKDRPLDPEGLPDLALHLVPLDGVAASLERDAEAVVAKLVGNTENGALPQSEDLGAIKEPPVLPRVMQPIFWGKCLGYFIFRPL